MGEVEGETETAGTAKEAQAAQASAGGSGEALGGGLNRWAGRQGRPGGWRGC